MIPDGGAVILVAAGTLFAVGLYCLVARGSLIRMVMGLEFLGKAVSLVFILGGYLSGSTGESQAIVFTLIAIEAVVAGLALAFVILAKHIWKTVDVTTIAQLSSGGED